MPDDRADVVWSPRVPKWKVRQLYEDVSQGIWDDALIDDVGTTLFCRCRDILRIYRAHAERLVTCPRCDRAGTETLIPRNVDWEVPFTCPVCGWSMTWRDYNRTYKRRQLNPGGAVPFFQAYVDGYPHARTARAKMLAIDLVIHSFHYSLRAQPDLPTRAACVNLIEGRLTDVIAFLDELHALKLPPTMAQTGKVWRETCDLTYRPGR